MKQLGLVAIGFAAGFLVASLLSSGRLGVPVSREAGTSIRNDVSADRTHADYERQIADLRRQLESRPQQAASGSGTAPAAIDLLHELRKLNAEERKKQEFNGLLAAGFTKDRIDWIWKRSAELEADWYRTEDQFKAEISEEQSMAMLAHFIDRDIGLRQELGDDEYARYRQATGRSIGAPVYEVTAGGIAERAGIKPGDQIIAYDGVRVFNQGELVPLMKKSGKAGTPVVAIDVVRNGQAIRFSAEAGDLRFIAGTSRMTGAEAVNRKKLEAAGLLK